MTENTPFRVKFDDTGIRLFKNEVELWCIKWDDLEAIGYRTTTSGPWFDDHFLVLRRKGEPEVYDISLEWAGAIELSEHVKQMEDTKLTARGTLVNCVQDDSITVWPSSRAGEPIV